MTERLNFIDVARAYAIALALFSHAMSAFGGWEFLFVPIAAGLKLVTRTATPLFVFMFGLMLELVYARRAARDGFEPTMRRLLKRGGQCYVGYALTAIAGVIGGYLTITEAGLALAFLDNVHLGNILRLYSIALVLAPAILWLRLRFGVRVIIAGIVAIWMGDFLLQVYTDRTFGPVTPWIGVVFGAGAFKVGPSVWHGFTFILAGMLVAVGLRRWREEGYRYFYLYGGALLVVALLTSVYLSSTYGVVGVLKGFVVYGIFRAENHIGYYAIGTIGCLLTLFVLSTVVPSGRLPDWSRFPLQFGYASLFSYSLGNIALCLIPEPLLRDGLGAASVPAALVFVTLMVVAVNWKLFVLGSVWALSRVSK